MQNYRYFGSAIVGLFAIGLTVAACSSDNGSDVYDGGSDGSAANGPFVLALGHVANATQAEAFKMLAHAPDVEVDPASVKFCFSNATRCAAGQGTIVDSQVFDADGRQVFVAQKYVKLSHDLRLTILAKDKKGADLTTGFTVVTKGKQPTPSNPPATQSSVETSSSTSPTTSTNPTTDAATSTTSSDPTTTQASACYKAPDDFTCQVELEITRLTNEKRKSAGLGELTYDKNIAYVSRRWSEEQARRMMISHEWFENGVWTQEYANEFGQPYTPLSENVVQGTMGSDALQVAASLVDLWWTSEPHKANILNPGVTVIGVGFAANQAGMSVGTQNFGNR